MGTVACGMESTDSGEVLMISHISLWTGLTKYLNLSVPSKASASSSDVGCLGDGLALRAVEWVEFM
jgi:hypothetical protein